MIGSDINMLVENMVQSDFSADRLLKVLRKKNTTCIKECFEYECLFSSQERIKFHFIFAHPRVKQKHEFVQRVSQEKTD